MEFTSMNAIPSEELKASPVSLPIKESKIKQNPLLYNKGFARSYNASYTLPPMFRTPPLPPRPPAQLHPIIGHATPPVTTSPKKESTYELFKKGTISSHISNDDILSNTSEMNSSERFNKLSNIFQLPLFEVHNSMYVLMHKRALSRQCSDEVDLETRSQKSLLGIHRSWTVHGMKRAGAENMKEELTPKQHEYFSKMNQFKTNYLNHVLNYKQIYFQYVAMSKADMSFLSSGEFIAKNNSILAQKKKFVQNKLKYNNKKTLVLDLDETLILATPAELPIYDTTLLYSEDDIDIKVYLKFRPFLKEFLEDMKEFYELVIYTSADQDYADKILDYIEGGKSYFAHRLYCAQCVVKEGRYLFKNLEILCTNREIKDIVIVDNSMRNYSLSVRNGIPILDFTGSNTDLQLVYLARYLRELAQEEDVRIAIKNDFADFLLKHYKST